jgi:hypothetical protein
VLTPAIVRETQIQGDASMRSNGGRRSAGTRAMFAASMLFVALSCLQGRPQAEAFTRLAQLPVDGIQLTPGNLPSPGFRAQVARYSGLVRYHHSFGFEHYRAELYGSDGRTPRLSHGWSIHPPLTQHPVAFAAWLQGACEVDALCEVMYPGYRLGSDAELEAAMSAGLRLAVDVSHLNIQQCRGDLTQRTLRRLLDYTRIEEVHVSHNAGRSDSHLPVRADTAWRDWAVERGRAGAALIFESRMHRHETLWNDQLESLR